jgi:hypothetical protein
VSRDGSGDAAKHAKLPPQVLADCEQLFQEYFGTPWNADAREKVNAAVRIHENAVLVSRELERVAIGAAALLRIVDDLPRRRTMILRRL